MPIESFYLGSISASYYNFVTLSETFDPDAKHEKKLKPTQLGHINHKPTSADTKVPLP